MARRLDYEDHRRELDANRYVYAVVSRRARGLSIGVNLNPDKACNFDCPYCQVDRTTPGGATLLHKDRVRAALGEFDEVWCKLDAGTEDYFHVVDGTRLPFQRILDNLLLVARERPIVVQSLFPTLDGTGPDDAEISAWVERMREIVAQGGRIDHVQVYTVARAPSDPRCGPLDPARLEAIAATARDAGLAAAVYA